MNQPQPWRFLIPCLFALLPLSNVHASSPVDLSPNSLNLGSQVVATTSGAGSVSLTNHLGTPLSISSISTVGDFAQTNNCPTSLAPGRSCTIKVTFTPSAVGVRSGQLVVTDNAGTSPQVTNLSGTGSASGLASISVAPSTASIALGLKQQFAATGLFKNGTVSDLTNSVVWSSSNSAIANISSQGLATSTGQGTILVSAALGTVSGSSTLTVTPPALVSIALTPTNPSVSAGKAVRFIASGSYTDGSNQNVTASVNWSSSNPSVATISNDSGLATGVAQGTVTIAATAGLISAFTQLVVNPPPKLVALLLSPNPGFVFLGKMLQFTALGEYDDGTTQDLTSSVLWKSSNPTVATISQGLATGLVAGTTAISAAVPPDGHSFIVSNPSSLTVAVPFMVSVTVKPANPAVQLGNELQLTATANFNDGSTADITTIGVIWASSNPAVATISNAQGSQGQAMGLAAGTTTITARSGSAPIVGATTLVVSTGPVGSIAVRPAFATVPLGDDQQFAASITLPDGSAQDATASVIWSSSNPEVATVSNSPGTQGRVTSLALGTTTITATDGSGSGSTALAVTPLIPGQARFAYVTNLLDSTISLYRVDGATGLLTPNGTVSIGDHSSPAAIAAASGKFIYTADRDANAISAYAVDSRAGLLSPVPGPQVFAVTPWALTAHPSGKFLLVANGPGTISSYSIDSAGALSFLSQTTASPGGAISVAVDPSGTFVYAANVNANSISAYTFDSATGTLTAIQGSPFATGHTPESVTVDPSGKFLYAPNGNGQSVSAFAIGTGTGVLTPIPGSPFAVGTIPTSIAIDPNSKFAYVTNQLPNTLSVFSISSSTGALQDVPGSPYSDSTLTGPVQAIVDPLGKTLFIVNQESNTISMFQIDGNSGALTGLSIVPSGLLPLSIALVQ